MLPPGSALDYSLSFWWCCCGALLPSCFISSQGFFITVLLRTIAAFFERHLKVRSRWALVLTVTLLLAFLITTGWLVGPGLAVQASQLVEALPDSLDRVEALLSQYGWGEQLVEEMPSDNGLPLPLSQFNLDPESVVSRLTDTIFTLWDVVIHLIFIAFVGLFAAVNPDLYRDGMVKLFPPKQHDHVRRVISELWQTLQGWLLGQIAAMMTVGVLTWFGLWLLGIPLALGLGLIAGILEFIPFIGPFIASIPAILIALTEGFTPALYVVILYITLQQIEGNILMPIIQKHVVDLPPALTLSAVFLLGVLFGFPGLLVATPLTAVILVLVKQLYVRDVPHEEVTLPGEKP